MQNVKKKGTNDTTDFLFVEKNVPLKENFKYWLQ